MSSSWTNGGGVPTAPRFLSADRASIARLAVVLMFAAAVVVGPLVGTTSASFTDSTEHNVTFSVPPQAPPVDPAPPVPDPVP